MEVRKTARGRPQRTPVEAVRVVFWYYVVRRLSKLSETKLEIAFDEINRVELDRHRGSRWNKYKSGIATPRRDLLERVERRFPGSLQVFDHPIWALSTTDEVASNNLRTLVEQLPNRVQDLFVRPSGLDPCDFWINDGLDHRAVVDQLQEWLLKGVVDRLTALAGLLVLVHDGRMRQREGQHFEAHLAMVAVASHPAVLDQDKFAELTAWRIESLLLQQWLTTNYADSQCRELIGEWREISSGPLVPWAPQQSSLKLGIGPRKKEDADFAASKGYWVGQRVIAWREQKIAL